MQDSQPKPSRRGFFFGAAAASAAAATAMVLPGMQAPEVALAQPKPAPEKGGGYSLTDHVERYYKTTRI
ncbi:MAG: formate dehydrogenase [Polaromonas sp.]